MNHLLSYFLLLPMLTQPNLHRLFVRKVRGERVTREKDMLAVEEPLEIRIASDAGTQTIAVTMRTPGEDFELAAGFLFNESVLQSREDIAEIRYCEDSPSPPTPLPLGEGSKTLSPNFRAGTSLKEFEDGVVTNQNFNVVTVHLKPGVSVDVTNAQRNFYTTSSCGVCGKASLEALEIRGCERLPYDAPKIDARVVRQLDATLRSQQSLFDKTGGLHAAALFELDGKLVALHEDVGRHNALDKLIGKQFLAGHVETRRGTSLHQSMLMVSGRTSFEIMQKALMARIPIVVAVGAPSSLAVEVAHVFNITLIGFARGESFNIYAGESRVIF